LSSWLTAFPSSPATWPSTSFSELELSLTASVFVQEQLGHQPLQPIDLDLQFAAAAVGIDLAGRVPLSPTMARRLCDPLFATEVRDRQSFGQIAVSVTEQSRDLFGVPSPSYGSLQDLLYPETPISTEPVFGEQASRVSQEKLA